MDILCQVLPVPAPGVLGGPGPTFPGATGRMPAASQQRAPDTSQRTARPSALFAHAEMSACAAPMGPTWMGRGNASLTPYKHEICDGFYGQ